MRDGEGRPAVECEDDGRADRINVDQLVSRPRWYKLEPPGTLDDAPGLAPGELVGGGNWTYLDEVEAVVASREHD